MNQIEALQRLRTLATPAVESRDVAALLQVSASNATTILRRLAAEDMIIHLSRGRWLVDQKIDRLALPELISAPDPAYISLQPELFQGFELSSPADAKIAIPEKALFEGNTRSW
jgi:hypothetical protein